MQTEKIEIKNTRYYQIINSHYKLALYVGSKSDNFEAEKAFLEEPSQERLGQIWQIIEVDPAGWKKDLFEIVHTRSTLVATKVKGQFFSKFVNKVEPNEVRLRTGKWGSNQLFYLEQVNPNDFPNIYRFSSYENRSMYLYYHGHLRVEEINPNDPKCQWEICAAFENEIINRSCYFQNAYSTLVMDVPGGSQKTGCEMIQWPLNNRFNQRFNLCTCSRYYKICNLNSKLYLTTSARAQLGQTIKQENIINEMHQLWILDYQGKNLYYIRSALNPEVMIGIRDNCIKQETQLVLTSNEDFGLWKIIGFIPRLIGF